MTAGMRALRWSPLLLLPLVAFLAARCGSGDDEQGGGGAGGGTAGVGGAGGGMAVGDGGANSASCPAAMPVHCSKCDTDGATCAFGPAQCCVCTVLDGERLWYCVEKKTECPATPATLDEVCAPTPTTCEYCAGGKIETRSCSKGKWARFPVGCG
jgi:hypothetical protein